MARYIARLTPTHLQDASPQGGQSAAKPEAIVAVRKPIVSPLSAFEGPEERVQLELLAHYRGVVTSRADLLALSKEQLDQITTIFRSTSVFLVRLRG
jgi:hypothetical protein